MLGIALLVAIAVVGGAVGGYVMHARVSGEVAKIVADIKSHV